MDQCMLDISNSVINQVNQQFFLNYLKMNLNLKITFKIQEIRDMYVHFSDLVLVLIT